MSTENLLYPNLTRSSDMHLKEGEDGVNSVLVGEEKEEWDKLYFYFSYFLKYY